jgi:hypothetical protein
MAGQIFGLLFSAPLLFCQLLGQRSDGESAVSRQNLIKVSGFRCHATLLGAVFADLGTNWRATNDAPTLGQAAEPLNQIFQRPKPLLGNTINLAN